MNNVYILKKFRLQLNMGKIKKIGIGLGVVVLSFVILVIIAAITYEDSTQQVS